ncbi:MAG TPA: DUF1501 domain-containing protein [Bryobacteraceae bacterium]|nr:DUF1501 domain-containing protein [Bryobacteraceae bacterium]
MTEQEKINREFKKHPWTGKPFFERPHWTRRRFFEIAGAGVTGAFLASRYANAQAVTTNSGATTLNTARNVIFVLLAGAPSHTDTFDLKMVPNVTPASFAPDTVNGILWPTGLLPNLGNQLSDFAIVRSMHAHALVHSLAQTWSQIGRNPAAALGNIAPNIGSVVAIEKDSERQPGQVFPTFLALNSGGAVGSGYLPAVYAPFKVTPGASGIADTTNPDGQTRFTARWNLMHSLDDVLRVNSPNGKPLDDYNDFYSAAQGMMYNPVVNQAFAFTAADSARYGSTSLGNACLVAVQVLKSQQGTRFIQITSNDGWDMHQNIYAANALPAKGKILDNAISALLGDLKANGLLDSTLVVMVGEFGRTVGPLSAAQGRDHWLQQFAFFAGGGVKGGTVLGATNDTGSDTADFGWSANRYVYPEDIEATIYSAMGIDWTTVRHDDPLGRGFEYVPTTGPVQFLPINELFGQTT